MGRASSSVIVESVGMRCLSVLKYWGGAALAAIALVMPSSAAVANYAPPKTPQPQTNSWAGQYTSAAAPLYHRRIHYVGQAWVTVSNDGSFGSEHQGLNADQRDLDRLGVTNAPSFEFPGGSGADYLYMGSIWIGGIVGTDTLVSMGIQQNSGPANEFNGYTPNLEGLPPGYTAGCDSLGAGKSLEQSYWCVYYDTLVLPLTRDGEENRPHKPLGLQITQVTEQASDNFSRRFVIFDDRVKNISDKTIENMWFGVFVDADIYQISQSSGSEPGYADDISGFLKTWPNPVDPRYTDTLNVGWWADNDGDPQFGKFPTSPLTCRGALAVRILRPADKEINFNWWTQGNGSNENWGPRKQTDIRDLGGDNGGPPGDRGSYFFMSNGEEDYGQLFAAQDYSSQGWKKPLSQGFACNIANGLDTRGMISVGPIPTLAPGEEVPFTFALIAGANVHQDPLNRFDCGNPQAYYDNLHFDDLARNAYWAGFVFDNYGVHSGGPGDYRGRYYTPIAGDTTKIYYTGDGCPDLKGPAPPPCPQPIVGTRCTQDRCDTLRELSIASRPYELEVTWTGASTETAEDAFIGARAFEGYKFYIAERNSPRDIPSADQYSLLASWDIVDYRRYTYEPHLNQWVVTSAPLTRDKWQQVFGDPQFDPLQHDKPSLETAYRDPTRPDSVGGPTYAYFAPQDFNQGDTILVAGEKTANLIQRVGTRDTTIGTDSLRYGVYRVTLRNLLPAKYYFVTVTAFDYGDPNKNRQPLETPPGNCRVSGIPIFSSDVVQAYTDSGGPRGDSVRVTVYPNPYKISFIGPDGRRTSYHEQGFEGRRDVALEERDRRINFINLPDSATIRIYTLDGDLIRTLNHPDKYLSEYSSKISWDLVSRNTQAVMSGIYIYRIDSKLGSQIGKIVIIK